MSDEKRYMNLDDAAQFLGIKRATLYNYMNKLEMKAVKFKLDRRSYLSWEQIQRLKAILAEPWLAGVDEGKESSDEAA